METATPSSGTVTINQARDNVFLIPLTGNVTSLAFAGNTAKKGQRVELHFIQDATGSRTLTGLPSSVKLAGGALTLTTTANRRDVLELRQVANPGDAGGAKYVEVGRTLNIPN